MLFKSKIKKLKDKKLDLLHKRQNTINRIEKLERIKSNIEKKRDEFDKNEEIKEKEYLIQKKTTKGLKNAVKKAKKELGEEYAEKLMSKYKELIENKYKIAKPLSWKEIRSSKYNVPQSVQKKTSNQKQELKWIEREIHNVLPGGSYQHLTEKESEIFTEAKMDLIDYVRSKFNRDHLKELYNYYHRKKKKVRTDLKRVEKDIRKLQSKKMAYSEKINQLNKDIKLAA